MAKSLSKSNIVTNNTILASDVSQSIDALTGIVAYDIKISGSLQNTGSVDIQGLLTATAGITHQLTASNAISASYVPSSGLPSGLLSSSAQIASDISGAFSTPSASFSTRVTANETNISTNTSNISTNTTNISTLTSKTGSYATTGSNQFNGDQQITGSLIVSGSTTSTIDTARLRVGEYFANGGAAVSQAEELYISGSGVQRVVIDSSGTAAILQLKSPAGKSAAIDFEEGPDQRWIIGLSASNDNFVIATGSALSEGVLFQVNRTTKDVEVINNLSASAVSASTYYGDGSNLTNIDAFPFTGDAVITGSLLISGSHAFRVDTDDIVMGTNAGAALDSATDSYNILIGSSSGATITTGDNNVSIGQGAMSNAGTTTQRAVCIGKLAGKNMTAQYNVAIGYESMMDGSGGSGENTAVGFRAGQSTTGDSNTYIGSQTGRLNTSAVSNVMVGARIGYTGALGSGNVLVGCDINRGNHATTAEYNSIIGNLAGYVNRGGYNIFLGYKAGYDVTTGAHNILIGNNVQPSLPQRDHELRIGSASMIPFSASLLTGDVLFPSTASAAYFRAPTASFGVVEGFSPIKFNSPIEMIGSNAMSGSFSGSYVGDGSGLTNLPASSAFPFVGDAVITGSLLISGSQGFRVDTDDVVMGVGAGSNLDSNTSYNVLIGSASGKFVTTADYVTFIGQGAGGNTSTGNGNVAIGYQAGNFGAGPTNNVAIGYQAMAVDNDAAYTNVAIGFMAMYGTYANASSNVVIGTQAGQTRVGDDNVIIGREAMYNSANNKVDNCVIIGHDAGRLNQGSSNIIIGDDCVKDTALTGTTNIFIGKGLEPTSAAQASMLKIGNEGVIAISASLTTGDVLFPSTASATYFKGDGSNLTNVSAFPFVGDAVITGSLLISGSQAFILDTTNVVLGQNAGGGTVDTGTDDNNVIIGTDAAGGGALNSGDNNIVIGHSAGYALSTGDNNIIIGYEAGKVNTATANTFIGSRSGQKNTTGYYNTFIGRDSGMECVEWQNNTYVGFSAGKNPQNEMNTAVGSEALLGASGTNTAEQNVALGYRALYSIASNGDGNVAVGHQAGYDIAAGTHNINIGFGATSPAAAVGDIRIGSGSSIPFSGSSVTGDVLFPGDITAMKGSSATHLLGTTSGAASLTLRCGSTSNAFLDFEEGTNNRYVIGIHGSTDQLRICNNTASPNSNTAISVALSSGDTTIHNNLLHSGSVTHATSTVASYATGDSPVTLNGTQRLVKLDSSGGTITVNVPDSATYPGMQIFFKVINGGNAVTLTRQGSDTIDGDNTNATLDSTDESLSIISDGAGNWYIF